MFKKMGPQSAPNLFTVKYPKYFFFNLQPRHGQSMHAPGCRSPLGPSRMLHRCSNSFPVWYHQGHGASENHENNPVVFTDVHDLGDNHLRQEATKPACCLFSWRLEAPRLPAQCGRTYHTQNNVRPCAHMLSFEKP